MAKQVRYTPSRDIHEFDLLPGHITRSNRPETIDLSASLRKYSPNEQDSGYRIRISLLSAAMQCISGTPENISSNLDMYRFTDVAGVVNCTQPIERAATVAKRLKESGAIIIPFAINTHDYKERTPAMVDAGGNLAIIDTSQGWSEYQKETIAFVKQKFRDVPVWGGNIVDAGGFNDLVEWGADAVKVGMGVGAGCITQEVLGVARKQATAIMDVARARDRYEKRRGVYVPIISDGGVKTFSDIPKAHAFGADIIMAGRLIAGSPETPNPVYKVRFQRDGTVIYEGLAKEFWYEASNRARQFTEGPIRDYSRRYQEGIEGWVRVTSPMLEFLEGGYTRVRDAIRKAGCNGIEELHKKARLELANRTVDPNDPDIAIWDPEHVKVLVKGEWIPSKELAERTAIAI
ncbi:MAG: guanosine monophosphate reductase [Candidatus Aenigmarchaeota archaeon]|nr:guanosine monophosphate reductase [Candidatus Aenigmarchaeota archaeon]